MEKKNTILLTVIAVATLLIAVVGATFAYFTAGQTNAGGTTTVTATSESVGSVTLTNETENLHLTLSASDMAQNNLGVYWATDVADANYDEVMTPRNIATATLTGGSETAKYECTATINVDLEGTMAESLVAGDAYVQFGGLLTERIQLSKVKDEGYQVTFQLDGTTTKSQSVTAAIAIENKNAEQNRLQGKTLEIEFSNSDFNCQVVNEHSTNNAIAYAVYSADDNSLNFYRSTTPIEVGDISNSK